jgi:hypothetical protein
MVAVSEHPIDHPAAEFNLRVAELHDQNGHVAGHLYVIAEYLWEVRGRLWWRRETNPNRIATKGCAPALGKLRLVISNGVINLAPRPVRVFAEAALVLRPGGRLAIADIITEKPLTEAIVCNADL